MELHNVMDLELNGFNIIRSSIYAGYGIVAGVAALAIAIRSLLRKSNGRRYNASIFFISLLVCDVIQLASSSFSILKLKDHGRKGLLNMFSIRLWLASSYCGLFFHQMVALEWILSLTRPLCFSRLHSNCCSFPISLSAWLLYSAAAFTGSPYVPMYLGYLASGVVAVGISITTWILCALKPPFSDHLSVLSVSTFTLVVLYEPFFIMVGVAVANPSNGGYALSVLVALGLTNLRLISDPVLCVLVSMREKMLVNELL